MELLLNLVWLAVSLTMVGAWFFVGSKDPSKARWVSVVALLLLVGLLLPAISMTDDLMAASSLAESEHVLQPGGSGTGSLPAVAWMDLVAAVALLIESVRMLSQQRRGLALRALAALLRRDFGRVTSVRPPPALSLVSA
ncbi:MAG: hypothetical protein NVSMB3_04700 [Acidobacteriaceae bacterium]